MESAVSEDNEAMWSLYYNVIQHISKHCNDQTFSWYPLSLPSNIAGWGLSAAVLMAGFANADPLPMKANDI